jgi:hypothetical protein
VPLSADQPLTLFVPVSVPPPFALIAVMLLKLPTSAVASVVPL